MDLGFCCKLERHGVAIELFGCKREQRNPMLHVFEGVDFSAVLLGKLYYSNERLDALRSGLQGHNLAECRRNQAALAAHTYLRFGVDGLTRLEGDFALLVWDARRQEILAARDPMGGYPLFWTREGDNLVISTSLPYVARLTGQSTIDQHYVAQFLMLPGQVQELPGERTAYAGVQRVLPGAYLRIDARSEHLTTAPYWDWLAQMVDPGTSDFAEVSEGYGSRLRDAVRERIGVRTAAHLSGGMDSTSVALLARDALAEKTQTESLHGITLVFDGVSNIQGEKPYIDAGYGVRGDIVRHEIHADHLADFDSFITPAPHPEPYVGLSRMSVDAATIEAAVACGADTLLTGIGADEMLVMSPFHIADMLRRGEMRQAWREISHWAEVDNGSPWSLMKAYAFPALLPTWSRAGIPALLHNGYGSWAGQNQWTITPWVRRSFARNCRMQEIGMGNSRATWDACRPIPLSIALYLIRSRYGDVDRWSLGVSQGIAIAHPFMDPRVFCYGLGMHRRINPRPEGQKPVLAHAMRNVLPAEILHRRRKVDFSPIHYVGLARNLAFIEKMIWESCLDDVLDRDVLLNCLRRAALGGVPRGDGMDRMGLTLSLLRWLSMHDQWRREAPLPDRTLTMPFLSPCREAC